MSSSIGSSHHTSTPCQLLHENTIPTLLINRLVSLSRPAARSARASGICARASGFGCKGRTGKTGARIKQRASCPKTRRYRDIKQARNGFFGNAAKAGSGAFQSTFHSNDQILFNRTNLIQPANGIDILQAAYGRRITVRDALTVLLPSLQNLLRLATRTV